MTDDWREKAQAIWDIHVLAYSMGPTGTWAQRWVPGVCKHVATRCTHGDEIIHRGFRRQVCLVCGRSLNRGLPEFCFFSPTKERHSAH